MQYDFKRVQQFVKEAKELEPLDFKIQYLWLTECMDFAFQGNRNYRLNYDLVFRFQEMSPWEKANIIRYLGEHLLFLIKQDFRNLAQEARDWDRQLEKE